MTKRKQDFLDEMILEESAKDPDFPKLYEAALKRRRLLRQLVDARHKQKLSQADVAKRLEVSQPSIWQLENQGDAKLSTLQRYADALGKEVEIKLKDVA